MNSKLPFMLAFILMFLALGCRAHAPDSGGNASNTKDISDGSNWCHARLKSTDQTEISIDYNVNSGVATPVWVNVKRPNKNSEKVDIIVVPYSYKKNASASSATVGQSYEVTLPFSQQDGRYTAQIPNGLALKDSNTEDKFIYEFAFRVGSNGQDTYLVDPISQKHNFRADLNQINRENRYICGDKPSKPALVTPAATSKDNPLEVDTVVDAMNEVYATFYGSSSGYSRAYNGNQPPPSNEPNTCYSACPTSRWSALACTYYCQFPSYSAVIPNIRGCFTSAVSTKVNMADNSPARSLTYPEAYDYCVFQDMDPVLKRTPAYDVNVIAANKAAGKKPGVMKWIDDNQEDVFKYIMFTNGNVAAFDYNDEVKAIQLFNQAGHSAPLPPFRPMLKPAGTKPAAVTGSCGGVMSDGFCWYSTTPQSAGDCNAACANHGGVHPATAYNFGDTDGKTCAETVSLLAGFTIRDGGVKNCNQTCGCIYTNGAASFLCTPSATVCQNGSNWLRACACNN